MKPSPETMVVVGHSHMFGTIQREFMMWGRLDEKRNLQQGNGKMNIKVATISKDEQGKIRCKLWWNKQVEFWKDSSRLSQIGAGSVSTVVPLGQLPSSSHAMKNVDRAHRGLFVALDRWSARTSIGRIGIATHLEKSDRSRCSISWSKMTG